MKSRKIERNIVYRSFRKDLAKRYGSEQAAEIWKYANREYQTIMADESVSDQMVRISKELGNPEAAQMICCMDKEYMTGIRGLDYRRTKALAEGHDCCDYRMKRTDLT